ncbi:MAG TPA: SGNH/GDSL hydrolase family protein [Vicinamibacteria bacterium]|nr:SGNH/GDSL hydrolase family protein [Vicinamibacteria bacterium]
MGFVRRAHLANVGLAAATMALTLLAVEAAARLALRGTGGGKEQNEPSQYMEHDPHRGWRHRPGARATYRRREYTTDVAINAQGLREAERHYVAPPGTFRVLALGDSFVEGYTVAYEQTVTQAAEKALSRPGCPVEVLNAGHAGYGTDQEYLFYRDEGVKYRPQVVLLFLFYNDIFSNTVSNYFGSPKPLLAVRHGALVLTNEPVPPPAPPPPAAPAPGRRPNTFKGSVALEWIRDRLVRGAPRAYNALARTGLWEPLGGHTIPRGDQLRVYKRRRQPDVEDAWTITAEIVAALANEVWASRSHFAVVHVPSRMEVSDRDWELTRLLYGLDQRVWDRGLVARRVAEMGRVGAFPVLDLTPALREATGRLAGDPYFLHDGHWNARGHHAAGHAVARFLRAQGWLPACASSAGP